MPLADGAQLGPYEVSAPSFQADAPQELFALHIAAPIAGRNDFPFEAAAYGKRFLVNTVIGEESEIPPIVVQKRLPGVKK